MDINAQKIPENKTKPVAENLPKQQDRSGTVAQLVNDRPEAIVQRKLQEVTNDCTQVRQLNAYQEMASNSQQIEATTKLQTDIGTQTIQKKGFADPANPNSTRQWEGTGYFSRDEGEERPAALANLVDQFKKEILTYIAHHISTKRNYGPHIAVVITGDNWNVSVNSNVADATQGMLQADAQDAKTHVDQCWDSLHNTYGHFFSTKIWFETDAIEAAYIAFRWAAGKSNVRAILNDGPSKKRRVHGEMRIIDTLKREAPVGDILPSAVHPVVPLPALALPDEARRVVRVGGTKTPCFDCAWEMDKVHTHTKDEANVDTVAPGAHDDEHHARMIGTGPNERIATTMSPTFGPSFPTWQSPDVALGRRDEELDLNGVANFQADQTQDYTALGAAYAASGCAPAMI